MATVQIKSPTTDNQAEVNSSHELLVTDAGAANSSVGPTGSPVPIDATLMGAKDPSGNLADLMINALGQLITTATGTFTPQGLKTKGLITMSTIDNLAWYEAPSSPLVNRNNVMIQNPSTSSFDIIYNYDNTAPLTSGVHIAPGVSVSIAIQNSIPVYITVGGAATIISPVEELS